MPEAGGCPLMTSNRRIGALVRALGNRAFLIERVSSSEASAEQIRTLFDKAGRIATMLDKGTAPERARVLCDLVERLVIEEDKLVVTMRRAALTETGADPISL